MECSPPGSFVHGILQARILEWVAFPSPGDLLNPGIKPMSLPSPELQADSLPLSHEGFFVYGQATMVSDELFTLPSEHVDSH